MCNIEFPHFGASYPDAHCIDGYLWDMDSYEDGCYTVGGDDPCPFCNTDAWLKTVLDNEEFASREEALEWVEKMREKWGAVHSGSSEIPNSMEEAANEYEKANTGIYPEVGQTSIRDAFIDGAKWQAEKEKEYSPWLSIQGLKDAALEFGEQAKAYEIGGQSFSEDMMVAFTRGAEWRKEQMLKEAVEGHITNAGGEFGYDVAAFRFDENHTYTVLLPHEEGRKHGDKVSIIILPKEDKQ